MISEESKLNKLLLFLFEIDIFSSHRLCNIYTLITYNYSKALRLAYFVSYKLIYTYQVKKYFYVV